MESGNESVYADITRKYVKGKIPFRVWMLSSFLGAALTIISNLVHHNAVLQGFFSSFFWNAVITIPIFIVQAHFVGRALQRNPENAKRVLVVCLLFSWGVIGGLLAWVFAASFESTGMVASLSLLIWNWVVVMVSWWTLSLLMFRVRK